jgi:hypothetical protein
VKQLLIARGLRVDDVVWAESGRGLLHAAAALPHRTTAGNGMQALLDLGADCSGSGAGGAPLPDLALELCARIAENAQPLHAMWAATTALQHVVCARRLVPSRALMSALREANFTRVVGTKQRNNLLMRLSLKLSRVGRAAEDALFWREAKWLVLVYLIYTPPMAWNWLVAPYHGPCVLFSSAKYALLLVAVSRVVLIRSRTNIHCTPTDRRSSRHGGRSDSRCVHRSLSNCGTLTGTSSARRLCSRCK